MSNYLYENMANSNNESGSLSCLALNADCMGSNIYGQTRGPVGDCCPGDILYSRRSRWPAWLGTV